MSSSITFASLLVLGLFGALLAANDEPANVQCRKDSDCPVDHCCVLGPSRYSLPQCSPMREKAETCRPYKEKLNTTLHYPNDAKLSIVDVSYILCPCNEGLNCDLKEGVCT